MGFFSWWTQDTNLSIANRHSSQSTFPVTMLDDKGNAYTELDYDGYGVFGGKDYYELLFEMNREVADKYQHYVPSHEEPRIMGISLFYGFKGIRILETNEKFFWRKDFGNWAVPIYKGKSANQLLDQGYAEKILVKPKVIYPNLVQFPEKWTYKPNLKPKDCMYQGFFY